MFCTIQFSVQTAYITKFRDPIINSTKPTSSNVLFCLHEKIDIPKKDHDGLNFVLLNCLQLIKNISTRLCLDYHIFS